MSLPKLDAPIYETQLISTGKVIRFRPFLVKEQKIFLMAAESDDENESINAIKQVLTNCILTEDVDVDNLPLFYLEYLFTQLRKKSIGEVSEIPYRCNNKIVNEETSEERTCGAIIS